MIVKINDRGPFKHDRLIDMSYGAALRLGMTGTGTARVDVRVIDVSAGRQLRHTPRTRVPEADPAAPGCRPVLTENVKGQSNWLDNWSGPG